MPLGAIIGHRQTCDLLRQAVAKNRVPQSLLFAGPAGVGKHAVALSLAQALNCPQRKGGDACGSCPTCQRVARGAHSDVVLLDRGDDASIKIKALRERVLDLVGYRPFEAARRVFIIDGADDLTNEAQDALLKTLEEPPPSAVLILVTPAPDTLLATVQSRCRRLRFGLLSEADVATVLIERLGLPVGRARTLAAASGGTIAGALAQEDDAVGTDREAALALLGAARQGAIGPRLKAATALAQHGSKRRDREALGARLAALASLTRDLGLLAASSAAPLANLDVEDDLRRLSSAFESSRVDAAFETIVSARRALDRNASPKIVADWLAIHL